MSLVRFLIFFLSGIFLVSCTKEEPFQRINPVNDEFVISHDKSDGIPHFYRAEVEGRKIDFFVIKLNGQLMVFLNRCRKCFNSGLGFRFEDRHIRCRACNVTYPVKEISKGIGSCYPLPVKARSEGRYLRIKKEDLIQAYSF
ncbi:MAG: Fe-S-containing protein [Thermodesulfovibrionales bacterium]